MENFKQSYEKISTKIDQQNIVVKHNNLVQKIRLNLSEAEQKTVIYAVSKIKPSNKAAEWIYFDIKSYCKACGIDADSGTNYKRVRSIVKSLRDKSQEVFVDGAYRPVSWFYDYKVESQDGQVGVLFNPLLEDSLYGLSREFLQYRLEMALPLDGKYTVALYEFFKSKLGANRNTYDFNINVDEFRFFLGIENLKTYQNFAQMKRKILEPALAEIEEKTDIFVQWVPVKTGRGGKVLVMRFDISLQHSNVMAGQRGIEEYEQD